MALDAVKAAAVYLFRLACNAAYRVFCLRPRRDLVIFVSRQANEPTRDFVMVGEEFQRRGFEVAYLTRKLSKRTAWRYAGHMLCELRQLARCRVCFLDRYDPVISLLDMKCDQADKRILRESGLHCDFPSEPVVVQLWHAFGAFKHFGFQSIDTCEGHSAATARIFGVHRNYSWIICSGEGCRKPYAQAFAYPVERVVALGRPEYELLTQRAGEVRETESDAKVSVLFAPTLRKSKESQHPLRDLYQAGTWKALEKSAEVQWSFHPLEETGLAPGDINDSLLTAHYVVTDYSSIVYEAYLLGKNVLFYVPDIDRYKDSPGLNVNPKRVSPEIAFENEADLLAFLSDLVEGRAVYPKEAFKRFVGDTFDDPSESPVRDIADFVLSKVGRDSA